MFRGCAAAAVLTPNVAATMPPPLPLAEAAAGASLRAPRRHARRTDSPADPDAEPSTPPGAGAAGLQAADGEKRGRLQAASNCLGILQTALPPCGPPGLGSLMQRQRGKVGRGQQHCMNEHCHPLAMPQKCSPCARQVAAAFPL